MCVVDKSIQSAKECPDWGKVKFVDYPSKPWSEILLHVAPVAVDFVQRLVQYESGWRMTASEVSPLPPTL